MESDGYLGSLIAQMKDVGVDGEQDRHKNFEERVRQDQQG